MDLLHGPLYFGPLRTVAYKGKIRYLAFQASKSIDLYLEHIETLKYLVNSGVDIKVENYKPFRLASKLGHLEAVKYLVSKGADVHADSEYSLYWASERGHLEVVKYLVSKGANLHAGYSMYMYKDPNTPLKAASGKGHLEVVKYLVSKGANIADEIYEVIYRAMEYKNLKVLKYLFSEASEYISTSDFRELLTIAARYKDLNKVVFLVKNGAMVSYNSAFSSFHGYGEDTTTFRYLYAFKGHINMEGEIQSHIEYGGFQKFATFVSLEEKEKELLANKTVRYISIKELIKSI